MANPPIQIGEITDVPAPESAINAAFHQTMANRVIHRFATTGELTAWAAGNGSVAFVTATGLYYGRLAGGWQVLFGPGSPYGLLDRKSGVYGQVITAGSTTQVTNCSITFTASPDRWYRSVGLLPVALASGTNPVVRVAIFDAAVSNLREVMWQVNTVLPFTVRAEHVESGLSGTVTRRLMVVATNSGNVQLYEPSFDKPQHYPLFTVEDLGGV